MDVSLDRLAQFLIRARATGYVGGTPKVATPQRPGFNEFAPYVEGTLEYLDSYAGYYYAPGQEVVRENGLPIWMMAYSGGMLPEHHDNRAFAEEVFAFLKLMLAHPAPDLPLRGPQFYSGTRFRYVDLNEGDLSQFRGYEQIFLRDKIVFRQSYVGGLVVPKI